MIRVGRYDAYDKWEILCRYWVVPESAESVSTQIVDKWDRSVLPDWQALARRGGRDACLEYVRVKLTSIRANNGVHYIDEPINCEIAQLEERLGDSGLIDRVNKLIDTITSAAFDAPFNDGLSPQLVERLRTVFKIGAIRLLGWADERGEIPNIDLLRLRSGSFPVNSIKHKRRVLSIFCALYYGRNDVIHIYDICPDHVTLVDTNAEALNDIQMIYPKEWTYVCTRFEPFLREAAARGDSYDLIVSDPPKLMGAPAAWDMLPTIMGMCSDTYITNYFTEMFDELGVEPDDLEGLSRAVKARTGVDVAFTEMMRRNSAVCWAVMHRR